MYNNYNRKESKKDKQTLNETTAKNKKKKKSAKDEMDRQNEHANITKKANNPWPIQFSNSLVKHCKQQSIATSNHTITQKLTRHTHKKKKKKKKKKNSRHGNHSNVRMIGQHIRILTNLFFNLRNRITR